MSKSKFKASKNTNPISSETNTRKISSPEPRYTDLFENLANGMTATVGRQRIPSEAHNSNHMHIKTGHIYVKEDHMR